MGTPIELCDPAAAYHYVSIVENDRLTWRNGALGLVERNQDFVCA